VYISGLLLDSLGMLMLALTKNRYAVIIFSASAGVMYSTLFTLPYLLVAHYHAAGTVSLKVETNLVLKASCKHSAGLENRD
jgi:solute carrier family 45 protein 1/2/4